MPNHPPQRDGAGRLIFGGEPIHTDHLITEVEATLDRMQARLSDLRDGLTVNFRLPGPAGGIGEDRPRAA